MRYLRNFNQFCWAGRNVLWLARAWATPSRPRTVWENLVVWFGSISLAMSIFGAVGAFTLFLKVAASVWVVRTLFGMVPA